MNESPAKLYIISLSINFLALGGGWAITDALAGATDRVAFLFVGGVIVALISLTQLFLLRRARISLVMWVWFQATLCAVFAWFLGALAVPLFWVFGINSWVSPALTAFFTLTLSYNLLRGTDDFHRMWREVDGDTLIRENLNIDTAELNLGMLKRYDFFGPVLPHFLQRLNWLISPALILSMIMGMNFRKVFPEASALAWGIPSLLLCAYSLKMTHVTALLAKKITHLEQELGITIRPMSDEKAKQRQRALRRRLKGRNR